MRQHAGDTQVQYLYTEGFNQGSEQTTNGAWGAKAKTGSDGLPT